MKVTYEDDMCKIEYGHFFAYVTKPIGEAVEKIIIENAQLKKKIDEIWERL